MCACRHIAIAVQILMRVRLHKKVYVQTEVRRKYSGPYLVLLPVTEVSKTKDSIRIPLIARCTPLKFSNFLVSFQGF